MFNHVVTCSIVKLFIKWVSDLSVDNVRCSGKDELLQYCNNFFINLFAWLVSKNDVNFKFGGVHDDIVHENTEPYSSLTIVSDKTDFSQNINVLQMDIQFTVLADSF